MNELNELSAVICRDLLPHVPMTLVACLALAACASDGATSPLDTSSPDTVAPDVPAEVEVVTDTATGPDTSPFVYPTACDIGQATRPAPVLRLTQVFDTLTFEMPIAMGHAGDGSRRLFIGERAGRIKVVHPGPSPRMKVALDISDKVYTNFECGFLGLALHPRHADTRKLYTDYCVRRANQTFSVISEWQMSSTDPDVVDPASERVLLEVRQPFDNHNGGALAFGPDGLLYIAFGDGGGGNDPVNAGQDTRQHLGKILRIDIDDPGNATRRYGIPSDNPFADGVNGRPEIFAWGLRNPWRMSFDRETGELWVGDVGQNTLEEVDIVERGKNYGWKVMEGTRCRPGGPNNCDKSGLELPVIEYGRAVGQSVTGGYVYRGKKAPSLLGRYVFADYASRGLFVWQKGDAREITASVLTTPGSVASFGEDEDGELYLLELETGRIRRLEEGIGTPAVPPPQRLSQTGCFTDLTQMTPAAGILDYSPQWPFWSDGAEKRRWVVLPQGGRITPTDPRAGPWQFPIGTVFIKHFELALANGSKRPVETRFLIQEELGTRGFTYRWDGDGRDATLLSTGATADVADANGTFSWHFPSPGECATCHRGSGVLGLDGYQLDEEVAAWTGLGLLTAAAPNVVPHPRPDSDAGRDVKARAWLDVNCGYCHDSGGPSGTPLDLRRDTALSDMAACGAIPIRGASGVTPESEARLIAPGSPTRSVVVARAARRDNLMMPPLASSRVDPSLDLVREWISALAACE